MVKINISQIQKIETEMLRETVEILRRNDITFYLAYGSALGTIRHSGPIPWDTDTDILIPYVMLEKARNCLAKELSHRFCIDDFENNKDFRNFFPRVAMPNTSSDTLHIDIFPLMGLPNNKNEQLRMCNALDRKHMVFERYKHFRKAISHPNLIKNVIGKFIEVFCSPYSKNQIYRQIYRIISKYSYDVSQFVTDACGCGGGKSIFEKNVFGTPVWKRYCDFEVPVPEQWDLYLRRYYKEYMEFPPQEERDRWLAFELEIDDRDYETMKDVIA